MKASHARQSELRLHNVHIPCSFLLNPACPNLSKFEDRVSYPDITTELRKP
jgi:hypothetical protein